MSLVTAIELQDLHTLNLWVMWRIKVGTPLGRIGFHVHHHGGGKDLWPQVASDHANVFISDLIGLKHGQKNKNEKNKSHFFV